MLGGKVGSGQRCCRPLNTDPSGSRRPRTSMLNWEAIGAVGESLGALVVVATLGYLAIQVRESRRATAEEGLDAALAALSAHERFLVSRYYDALMVRFDNVCFQSKQGFIPAEYLESNKIGMRQFGPVWRRLGLVLPPELDRVLRSVLDGDSVQR
jgi:hypothetical protein